MRQSVPGGNVSHPRRFRGALFLSWSINLFYLMLGRAYRMSVLGIFTAPAIAVLTVFLC